MRAAAGARRGDIGGKCTHAATVATVPVWLTDVEYRTLSAACERMIPQQHAPGAVSAGVPDYVDGLLGAFTFDPPRIWAGGPFSGRNGGDASFGVFMSLGGLEELAWRTRIEGSAGFAEREFNGPVVGWQERYRRGLARLGEDFAEVDAEEQERRLAADPEFSALLYGHCCEGMYGAPEYGGNRNGAGWDAIGFAGDVQPRGWTDDQVAGP
jgi:hypothetical protein